jgi:transglutaminase-like putative cysteine protease
VKHATYHYRTEVHFSRLVHIALANTYRLPDKNLMRLFLYPSEYTRESPQLLRLLESEGIGESEAGGVVSDTCEKVSDTTSVSAKVARLCAVVYEALEYAPATPNINTTADQALVLGRGVCQDLRNSA